MKKLLFGIIITLLIPITPLIDWAYYRDKKPFTSPVYYTGEVPIRNDVYGDGLFSARRKGKRRHTGLDICAPLHSEVMASKGGRAIIRFQKYGMGKYIVIAHSCEYSTLYGHLSGYCVKDKQRVRQGDIIGFVGKTGNANHKKIKPHLHFEIRKDEEYLNPLLYLE